PRTPESFEYLDVDGFRKIFGTDHSVDHVERVRICQACTQQRLLGIDIYVQGERVHEPMALKLSSHSRQATPAATASSNDNVACAFNVACRQRSNSSSFGTVWRRALWSKCKISPIGRLHDNRAFGAGF